MENLFTHVTLCFYGVALLGMIAHAVVKWINGDIIGNPIDWFIMNRKATVIAVSTALGGTTGAIMMHMASSTHVGGEIMAIWGIGWAADSTFNKQRTK